MQRNDDIKRKKITLVHTGVTYTLEDENRLLLDQFPADVQILIGQYLPASDKLRLASRVKNKRLFSVFQPSIRPARKIVHEFLLHVAHGEFAQVEAMIQKDPGLLLEKAIIKDYSDRVIEGTALQIALGAADVSLGTPCQLVSVSIPPSSSNLHELNIQSKTAYVRYDDKLFYIDKANNNECTEIRLDKDELKHIAALKQFDAEMKPQVKAQTLSEDQLKRITALSGHIHEEGMAEMIQRYLRQLPNGEEKIAAQIREQFPDGWEKIEEEKAARDLIALKKVVQAIASSHSNDDCATAVQTFLAGLKPQDVIKTGMHSNRELLVEALELYGENYDCFGGWDTHKNNLFWREIIGGIECFATARDAQELCQGPYYIVEEGEKLKRSLKFRYSDNGGVAYFYPPGCDPHFRLGKEYAGGLRGGGRLNARGSGVSFDFFTNYVKQKTSVLRSLCNGQTMPRKVSAC